jgi:hypothetical protein
MSLAKNPIRTPQDLVGKEIGVQSFEQPDLGIVPQDQQHRPSSLTTVPVQFDPAPLVSGQLYGFLSFITNEPVDLRHQGVNVAFLLFANYGFDLFEQIYLVDKNTLTNNRNVVTAALRAEIRGWRRNIANPALGAGLGVHIYGKGLSSITPPNSTATAPRSSSCSLPPLKGTASSGWTRKKSKVRKTLASLGSPIPTTAITNEILADIYKHGTKI